MNIEISKSEFMDRITKYDSCSLSYRARSALYDYIEGLIDEDIVESKVCIGDWAIMTSEVSALEILEDHDVDLEEKGLDPNDTDGLVMYVQDRIAYDGFDNLYINSVHLGTGDLLVVHV